MGGLLLVFVELGFGGNPVRWELGVEFDDESALLVLAGISKEDNFGLLECSIG